MFSLIVCSVNPAYLQGLRTSVSATIGVEHEWLVWDNRGVNTGLCEVYNTLAAQAKYPNLIFLHEDLLFKTNNWGQYLSEVFADASIGLIGVAGSSYKSKLLSGWYSGGGAADYSYIIHRLGADEYALSFPEKWPSREPAVVCIDGVFMVCRKALWEQSKFDQDLLRGFHFYDIDFSVRIAHKTKVVVTREIDIVHLTVGGDFGDRWVKEAFIYHNAAKDQLPFSTENINTNHADTKVARYWLDWLKSQPVTMQYRLLWVMRQQLYTKPALWYSIAKFLSYRPLGLKYIHRIFKKKGHS